jgi:3-methylcrotonyl-CoA carboxylase alpha subunit
LFKKILIANRGEIACRVAATARRMGMRTVAVYSDADAEARHVQACDSAVHIGPAAPRESYLRADRIVAAALSSGAEAVHPGYGFLSENAEFAEACAAAGLVFIGPPASAIRAMGLKAQSKRLMAQAGVPLVPGYHGDDQDPARLRREADAIGYPVLIKASAGGGGKGMRIVESAPGFGAALAACRREAIAGFGNGDMLIERYLTRPRHIEVQVFADTQGQCVYLFERDCSVQRRHQKVLEEAPAPHLGEATRQRMGAAAVAAARAVGYVGAGTVEFIAEPRGGDLDFHFMEMNTRLQVEHPVTEAITGLDLVEWQLCVAAGQPLPLAQHELRRHGHAIEARLCAENPDQQFLPSTGRLDVFRTPPAWRRFEPVSRHGAATVIPVRLDAGVREGDTITPHYDPMIAKLIVWGADRPQALARLDAALAQTHIAGPHTNVDFLRRVVRSRSFAEADLDTALIQREAAVLFDEAAQLPLQQVAAGVAAHLLAADRPAETSDPWSRRDGWRLHGGSTRHIGVSLHGKRHTFALRKARDGGLSLVVDGHAWPFAVHPAPEPGGTRHDVTLGLERLAITVHPTPRGVGVFAPRGSATVDWALESAAASTDEGAEAGRLTAPMPGKLLALLVEAGSAVVRGQPLAVMEAMKMEHTIAAPHPGTVQAWLFAVGDQVRDGEVLLRMGEVEVPPPAPVAEPAAVVGKGAAAPRPRRPRKKGGG